MKPATWGRNEPASENDVTRILLSRISLYRVAVEILESKMLVQLRRNWWLVHFDLSWLVLK